MHLHVNKSSPIFPLFFFELKPQIEKKRSIQELDDLILINSLANLLKSGNLIAFLIQNDAVEYQRGGISFLTISRKSYYYNRMNIKYFEWIAFLFSSFESNNVCMCKKQFFFGFPLCKRDREAQFFS